MQPGNKNKAGRSLKVAAYGLCLALMLSACGQTAKEDPKFYSNAKVTDAIRKAKTPDYWPTEEWKSTTPEKQGINADMLADWVTELSSSKNVHSFIVIRNGYIVAEGYNSMVDKDTKQDVKSVTKSFTSAMTGIAIDQKKLPGVGQTLGQYFPEAASDVRKSGIKLENLLIMRAGLEWDNVNDRSAHEMADSANWEKYVIDKPVVADQGTAYNYSNGNAHLMSLILEKATGEKLQAYANKLLLEPLGITDYSWGQDPQGHTNGAFSLHLKARDMAKLGLLYLHGGKWAGKEIVPRSWVEQSVSKNKDRQYEDGTLGGYGYFWWLKKLSPNTANAMDSEVFYAAGSEGQRIFVVPDRNMIVVMTSDNAKDGYMPETMLVGAVEAVTSSKALPANPEGDAKLEAAIGAFKKVKDGPL